VGPRTGLEYMRKRKFLPVTGLELRLLSRPARNLLLYRLPYPGSSINHSKLRKDPQKTLTTYVTNFIPVDLVVAWRERTALRKQLLTSPQNALRFDCGDLAEFVI
jgi:hypothetical protein